MTQGLARDGGDKAQGSIATRDVELERSGSLPVAFAPGATTVMTFRLKQKAEVQPEHRPDLGIGADDVIRKGNRLSVTVHSLGSVAAPGGTLTLETPEGKVLASAPVPALAAPSDLSAKTAAVSLTVPAGAPKLLQVRVSTGAPEVTQRNNVVIIGETD
jgi:hypothetical protein